MTVFKFKNPECHLQNQVGKRSNSNNLANLGNTKKVWCDKNDITSCYFWLFFSPRFSALPVYSKSQRFWAWDSLRKPWNFVLYFTQGKWLDSLVIQWNTLVLWIEIWFSGCRRQSYCQCAAAEVSFIWKEVSRVKLNNAGKCHPHFNWLQPEWNYRHICLPHSCWHNKIISTYNC